MGLVETKKTITEKPLLWFGVGIVVLSLIALSVVLVLKKDSSEKGEILALIDKEAVYKKDLNERIYGLEFSGTVENPPEISAEEKKWILDDLVTVKIAEKEAKNLNIEVTSEEIDKVAQERLGEELNEYSLLQKDIVKKRIKGELLKEKVLNKSLNWREGKFIICRFDYPYEFALDVNSAQSKKMIEDDKAYAEKFCNDLYSGINSGKMTFDEAMQKLEVDKTIGRARWTEMYDIQKSFDRYEFSNKSYYKESTGFWDVINSTHKNQVSKPAVAKMKDEDGKNERDAFYFIAQVSDEVATDYNTQDDWFNKMKEKYKVEYKVNY